MRRSIVLAAVTGLVCGAAGFGLGLTMVATERGSQGGSAQASGEAAVRPAEAPAESHPGPAGHRRAARPAAPVGPEAVVPMGESMSIPKERFVSAYRSSFARSSGPYEMPDGRESEAWIAFQREVEQRLWNFGRQDGHAHQAQQVTIEAVERADMIAWLDDDSRRDDLRALRNSPSEFAELLAHQAPVITVDGPAALRDPKAGRLADGTTLQFPPGVYELNWARLAIDGFPKDITIAGAGMDNTLIRLSDFSTRGIVWNLHIRDCTIDCGNTGAFDLRNERASVLADRVRFVRFDAGHGGCYIFGVSRPGAVYARDCIFAGGYGKSPGKGQVFRRLCVARFETCRFERITYTVIAGSAAYVGCRFVDCPDATTKLAPGGYRQTQDVLVDGCAAETTLSGQRRSDLRRSPSELFPGVSER